MIRFYFIVLISSLIAACSPTSESEQPAVLNLKIPIENDVDTRIFIEVDTIPSNDSTKEATTIVSSVDTKRGYEVKYLAIHCTASPPSAELEDIDKIEWWQKARGWKKWGYHVVFHRNGKISICNPNWNLDGILLPEEMVYGVRGLNKETISIAYVGGVTEETVKMRNGLHKRLPEDNMTMEQYYAMRGFLQAVQAAIPDIQIGGHRDFRAMRKEPFKACPSFEVAEKFGDIISLNNLLKY